MKAVEHMIYQNYIISNAKPFFKWVGGKRQLASQILPMFPQDIQRYYEPFIGGGALMWRINAPKGIVINDLNPEIANVYQCVKDCESYQALLRQLHNTQNVYNTKMLTLEDKKNAFLNMRALDRNPKTFSEMSNVCKALRFLFINKTGFNGLYRQNLKGQVNTPFGKHTSLNFDFDNLSECHTHLANVEIRNLSFQLACEDAKEGDFVYLDPPYDPVSRTASFTSYTASRFDAEMQSEVLRLCERLNQKGVKFMVSNSDTPFIRELYKDFKINVVSATRRINRNANGRGAINELVITNY